MSSNPFETPAGGFPNAPGVDARVNPFSREDASRERGASASEEEFSNPFDHSGARGGGDDGAFGAEALPEVPLPDAPSAYAPTSHVDASLPPEPVNPGSTFGAYDVEGYAQPAAQASTGQSAFAKRGTAGGFASSAATAFKSAFSGFSGASSAPVMPGGDATSAALAAQQRDLERREAEILRRERDLELRERNGGGSGDGGKTPNWPCKCYPMTYHNIGEEIPSHHSHAVRMCYLVYCILVVALIGNLLVAAGRLFLDGEISSFLMAFIYFVCGTPGAWSLWYKRVYNSCKRDRALGFLWFFLMFLLHMAFVVYASLAPPGFDKQEWSLCGVLNLSAALRKSKVLGIFHAVVMSLFMADAALSILTIRWVYYSFRGGGHSIADIRSQAYAEGARSAMSQSV